MRDDWNRREFLARSAGAAAGLLVPAFIFPGCGDTGAGDTGAGDTGAGDTSRADVDPGPSATVFAAVGAETTDFYRMGQESARSLGFHGRALAGATVFLKPNFVTLGLEFMGVRFDPAVGECTKPELVAAVAEQCLEAGATRVVIGEGAQAIQWDWATLRFIEGTDIEGTTNLKTAVERLQGKYPRAEIELQCLNAVKEWVRLPSSSAHENVRDGIHVARAFAEADHVISLPVMKSHRWALVTAAMKNYVGLVSSRAHGNMFSRCKLHLAYKDATCFGIENAGVSASYVDIHKWRLDEGKEDFAVLDGTICLEGDGPHTAPVADNDGQTIHTKDRNNAGQYFMLASNDLVAMDVTATQLMGIPVTEVKSLRMCEYLALGEMNRIRLEGASMDELRVQEWRLPSLLTDGYFDTVPGCKR